MKRVCYAVMLQSQLGPRAGELMLQEDTQAVSGYLSLLGHRTRFSGSVLQSGKYLISGDIRSPVDQTPYDAIFTIQDGQLFGGLITSHGCWDLTGFGPPVGRKNGRRAEPFKDGRRIFPKVRRTCHAIITECGRAGGEARPCGPM